MVMVLPIRWHSTSLNFIQPPKVIYGFHSEQKEPRSSLYLTNFKKVWAQVLNREEMIAKAKSLGIDEVNNKVLAELVNAIEPQMASRLSFDQKGPIILVKVDIGVNWTFDLQELSPTETIEFLAKLNYQQFANTCFLNFQICKLKSIIDVKDSYARFVATNFEQSHGNHLLKTYRKNNIGDAESIDTFDQSEWQEKATNEYRKKRLDAKFSRNQILDKNIDVAISIPWEFANEGLACEKEVVEDVEEADSHKHKQNFPNSSPTRPRQRIGMMSGLKRSQDDKAPSSPSPKKTRRIGQL
ncbi:hypothetical protein KGF56_002102 [Candida oxycetoniae]|uniref:XLF-like N-terminal domain-containing protein n=1 Tax=Candida oxycetoniae TaxID=497107 RepID=A0AAI9SYK5_9ASCO|nr:uncharacterized protein KGF56_002102 [Candida oxycetoniae]KAI3405146.2 hypothetical protein KGF56_002102 [Candida oxycetoniae]